MKIVSSVAIAAVASLVFCAVAHAAEPFDARVREFDARIRESFTIAWQAKHDTKTDPEELAVSVYWQVALSGSPWSNSFDSENAAKPFPDDASAELIIRGEHGNASSWRLYELTQRICLDIITARPAVILNEMARDFRGDLPARRRAYWALSEWRRDLYHHTQPLPDGRLVITESAADLLEQIVLEMYPVVSKRYQELKAAGETDLEPLGYVLRDMNDPRAILILLGKDGAKIERKQADPGLVKLLADADPEVRWRAAFALAGCIDAAITADAIRLLNDQSPRVRRKALRLAYFLPPAPELDAQFKALLKDSDLAVRQECVILLADRKDIACAHVLLALLRNEEVDRTSRGRLVWSMESLTGEAFGYHIDSDAWQPTTPNNRAALEKLAAWIAAAGQSAGPPATRPDVVKGQSGK